MNAAEEWRAVVGFEGFYEVSSHGRVRRIATRVRKLGGSRVLRDQHTGAGYRSVDLFDGTHWKLYQVHRLVLAAFVGACPHGMESRHLDGDKTNNSRLNLAWGTHAENMADQVRHGTRARGTSMPTAKLTEAAVVEIRRRCKHASLRALSREFGVTPEAIRGVVRGLTWAHVVADSDPSTEADPHPWPA